MNRQKVTVIDGPVPAEAFDSAEMEPQLWTSAEDRVVFEELAKREPLFHRPEFGMSRAEFEKMTEPEFWEIGASGRRYSRKFVLDTLEARYRNVRQDVWELSDMHCAQIAPGNYLFTYTLHEPRRITRRATIWRRTEEGWKVVFHQGTPAA